MGSFNLVVADTHRNRNRTAEKRRNKLNYFNLMVFSMLFLFGMIPETVILLLSFQFVMVDELHFPPKFAAQSIAVRIGINDV